VEVKKIKEIFEKLGEYKNAPSGNVKFKKCPYCEKEDYKFYFHTEKGVFNQIGCKPASALTVWKTQGQTLDNAYIDLEKWTPEASCYVALSRLKSLDGLGLKRKISARDIKVSKESLDFLSKI
jgi:hypothetical protein